MVPINHTNSLLSCLIKIYLNLQFFSSSIGRLLKEAQPI
jgi:hypothetical protein